MFKNLVQHYNTIASTTDYLIHSQKTSCDVLVLGLIIRDEEDIIEHVIRHHHKLGVDAFIVTLHQSKDNTVNIVRSLAKEFNLEIIEKNDFKFQQKKWSNDTIKLARKRFKADWVIVSDADEFWHIKDGLTFKDFLRQKKSYISAHRYNVIPEKNKLTASNYLNFNYVVINPIKLQHIIDCKYNTQHELLKHIAGKLILRPEGFISVRTGAHSARVKGRKVHSDDIWVLHYPIRSEEQFIKRTKNQIDLIEQGLGSNSCKKWSTAYKNDPEKFEREILNMCPDETLIKELVDLGIACDIRALSTNTP